MSNRFYISAAVCTAVAVCVGCGKKVGDEPTKYQSQAGLEKLTAQAQQESAGNAAFNRSFDAVKEVQGKAPEVRDLDVVIKPVLKKIFADARIIFESTKPETKKDGEVVENRFVYAVQKRLVAQDGKPLHAAFRAAHFGASPRLGSEPTIWSGGAVMSLFKTTSMRSYSLVISVDTRKQQIVIESYKLGSKYDRLM